jgi:ABC-type transport system involved in multi-copper enzyme maturation permease subunit
MRQFWTIASNAFMELVRQPVFLLLMTASGAFIVFLAVVPYFGFGDDPKMVKDMVLAVMLLSGLLGAVLSASASVAQEVRTGTALAVLAKPVNRLTFVFGKYTGLAGALTLLSGFNLIACLLAGRMAFDAYDDADMLSVGVYFGALALAYIVAALSNFFLQRVFVADAVFAALILTTLGFVYLVFFTKLERSFGKIAAVDWQMVPAGVLLLFAIWILAGVALAASTRLELIPTLAVCSGIFVLGLMSDYLFGQRAEHGQWWAAVLYGLIPNWQLFWMSDAVAMGKKIPWSYVVQAAGYLVGYLGATLSVALLLFQDRELN